MVVQGAFYLSINHHVLLLVPLLVRFTPVASSYLRCEKDILYGRNIITPYVSDRDFSSMPRDRPAENMVLDKHSFHYY